MDEQLLKEALNLYRGGMSLSSISRELSVDRRKITKYIRDNGEIITNPLKKYHYDETYFSSIDSEEKAYWLGFIYADGSVYDRRTSKTLEISLKESDRGHLVKFLNSIDGKEEMIKNKVVTLKDKEYKACKLAVNSTKMCNDLIRLGVVYRKSLVLTFPTFLEPNLIRHFIRGYFDGDGCIHKEKRSGNTVICLVGTANFLNDIQKYFVSVGCTKVSVYQKKGQQAYQFNKTNLDAIKILNYLYSNANVYLNRKFMLYNAV